MARVGASLGVQVNLPNSFAGANARSAQTGSSADAPLGLADAIARAKACAIAQARAGAPPHRAGDAVSGSMPKPFGSNDVIDLLSGDEADDADVSCAQKHGSTHGEHHNRLVHSNGNAPMAVDEDHVIVELDDDAMARYKPPCVKGLSSAAAPAHHVSSIDEAQHESEITPEEGGAVNLSAAAAPAEKEMPSIATATWEEPRSPRVSSQAAKCTRLPPTEVVVSAEVGRKLSAAGVFDVERED